MVSQSSSKVPVIVMAVVLIAAVLMIFVVPFLSFEMVNPIVTAQQARIAKFEAEGNPQAPLLKLTVWLVSFFYPFWGTLSVIAGIVLIVIAKALSRDEGWARGLAMIMLALPSIGGAYMIVPWMNFIGSQKGGFPPAVIIMMVGLVGYFALLISKPGDLNQKIVDALVFLMLGVTAAENFANGHASFRILYGHPKRPLFAEGIGVTFFSWLALWIAWILLMLAIYQLAMQKKSGWYIGMIGGVITVVASAATHYVRHTTNDYLFGALMGLSIVVMLLIPFFKERLVKPEE